MHSYYNGGLNDLVCTFVWYALNVAHDISDMTAMTMNMMVNDDSQNMTVNVETWLSTNLQLWIFDSVASGVSSTGQQKVSSKGQHFYELITVPLNNLNYMLNENRFQGSFLE